MFNFKSLFTMRLFFFSYLILVTFMVTSCQKNNDSDSGVITTDCISYPQACQGSVYNQPGFTPYNYNYNGYGYGQQGGVFYNNGYYGSGTSPFHQMYNSAYLCNCPVGSVPTYNNYGGLGCVQSSLLGGFQGYAYYGYNTSNNNQWTNIPQISNVQGYNNSSCYNGVVQSCIVNDQSTCRSGYSCRASSAASAIGICVSNGANGQTGQIYR